jgi:hypothetical protein
MNRSLLRPLALMICGLFVLGCPASDDTASDQACQSDTGTLSGQLFYGDKNNPGSPAAYARVQAWDTTAGESQEDALLISSDDKGRYTVDLPAATWTLAGISEDGLSFSSEPTTLTLDPCEDLSLDFHLDDGFG